MPRLDVFKAAILGAAILVALALPHGKAKAQGLQTATVAGGCFWCVESDFERVPGVAEVVSGFTGGSVANPSYRQVVAGGTGHLEAVEIRFDPSRITYRQILDLFLRSIDPTDAGGQFCDRGESYTTAIFVENSAQRADAEAALAAARAELGQRLVTPIRSVGAFYEAEAYHQDYHESNEIILTRFGPRRKSVAYDLYRDACGRDQRVAELWGANAPFVN